MRKHRPVKTEARSREKLRVDYKDEPFPQVSGERGWYQIFRKNVPEFFCKSANFRNSRFDFDSF